MALSRRHRRVLWTVSLLTGGSLIGGLTAWKIQRDRRPQEYEPGEASADITSTVEAQHRRSAPAGAVSQTASLRDPGMKLPPGAPPPRFKDVTKDAGLGSFCSFIGPRTSQLPEDMGSGAAWGDFDNDGFDDLFLVSAGGALNLPESQRAPCRLFRNLGDGTFQQVDDFPETRILGMGAAFADYNNDGWLDLVVTGIDTILLFRNDHGHFVRDRALPSPKGFWTGAAWGDYNRDGNLDLYVCGYVRYKPDPLHAGASSKQFDLEVPFTLNPSSFEPERNLLFRNNGDGTFTEVAGQLAVSNPEGRSLSALWHDFDNDGWLDLYVANDVSENKLYLNRHGTFVDAGKQAWISEYRGSMGLAAGDFDRDGDDDLFIAHWIAQQDALYQSLWSEQKLLKKPGPPELHFTDVAEARGIGQPSMQSIGWGTSFFDFDSDGWLDLVVANGSTFESKGGQRRLEPMPSFLFWNDRGEFFRDLAPWNRSLATPHVSRGLAVADYDNDGAMDILIVDHGEGARLLRNAIPQANWIELKLHSRVGRERRPIGFGDGATVTAWVNNVPLRRTVTSASYLSQDSRRVHVGLGAARTVDRLEVQWLGGPTESWNKLAANRIWEITEGDPVARPWESRVLTTQFWGYERGAMDAMKRQGDFVRAAALFRQALALNPAHEDSLYYLANCLAAQGDVAGALAQLQELARINPQSHRAWQRRGALLAGNGQFAAAEEALATAHRLNPEETGTLLLMGETALARGDLSTADKRLELACRTNPRAAGALFLRAYIAWKRGDVGRARTLLAAAATARGPDFKPKGAVAEGDAKRRMFGEAGFLSPFWDCWDGVAPPPAAFQPLSAFLGHTGKRDDPGSRDR